MQQKQIVDAAGIQRSLTRISYEIIERNHGLDNLICIGIKTRGEYIAQRISARMAQLEGKRCPVYALDITPFRDDQPQAATDQPQWKHDLTGKNIVLVDDVLYTGRTIRAAMTALRGAGRPASIALAVLVDRGHHELPIRADFVGKNIPTSRAEHIQVQVQELDGNDSINIYRED
ncbi:bifunctional pyr operon transcriptional regulator/uracil phosphoribosyltransferase PyrR [Lacticaseibacillus zhaodongensis]|uniref:bifunctional pyr operon transcriptional regulator/uracil phosphoribosyltransferase PyrR n=1 Tax=Lacticaseibacillus zhaodongensis TaxID=2668065 RepID=UPI0012D30E28|nr:bifunctional pyr operon transcriptional regulator/uracil phosphoribosyltransferase PyrR [Lacticaseibacillus zhaodongensis]